MREAGRATRGEETAGTGLTESVSKLVGLAGGGGSEMEALARREAGTHTHARARTHAYARAHAHTSHRFTHVQLCETWCNGGAKEGSVASLSSAPHSLPHNALLLIPNRCRPPSSLLPSLRPTCCRSVLHSIRPFLLPFPVHPSCLFHRLFILGSLPPPFSLSPSLPRRWCRHRTCTHACTRTHARARMHAHACTHPLTHTTAYPHMHACARAHTHTHTHTAVSSRR